MAVPTFKPVTVPSSTIVAIDVSSIDHLPVLSVASAGAIVTTSLIVLPTSTLAVVGATVTPVTATVLGPHWPPHSCQRQHLSMRLLDQFHRRQ